MILNSQGLSELIEKTEEQLRIFVDQILTYEYGDWENNPKHLVEDLKKELVNRQSQEQTSLGNSHVRLVDYTHILELKEIITKHSDIFKPIFSFPIDHYFDKINSFRIAKAHSRVSLLRKSNYQLVIGICNEILNNIDEWNKGKGKKIQGYYFNFTFHHPLDKNNSQDIAEKRVKENAENWIHRLEMSSGKIRQKSSIDEFGEGIRLQIKGGHIVFVLNDKITVFYGNYLGINIHTYTTNLNTIDFLIQNEQKPYRLIIWLLKYDIDVNRIFNDMNQFGKFISSSSGIYDENNLQIITSFDHGVKIHEVNYRISIQKNGYQKAKSTIALFYESLNYENGFFKAHRLLSPDIIFSYLYGKLSYRDFSRLLESATKR